MCFGVGLSIGAVTRSVRLGDNFRIRTDVLEVDIPDAPVPIDAGRYSKSNRPSLSQPVQSEEARSQKETQIQVGEKSPGTSNNKAMIFRAPKASDLSRPAAQIETTQIENDFIDCDFTMPEKPVFDAKPIKNILAFRVQSESLVKLALFFENTGNIPWFSANGKCLNMPHVNLGTMRERDRASMLYNSAAENGWIANNRITMQTPKVEPGQIGVFEFTGKISDASDIYREFFALVVEGKEWMKNSEMMIDFYVGETGESQENLDLKSLYIANSMPFSGLDLTGEKKIEIDLSEQKMYVYLGDVLIRAFRVSTGAYGTPTPTGDFTIGFKQKVRIAGGGTPYIMPLWQTVYRGVGLHALPSLGNARLRAKIKKLAPDEEAPTEWFQEDSLWTEAVDHIGRPVSHGCIRLLPEDARFMYEFTEEGTLISIRT